MPKISQLPSDVTPATSDYVAGVQASVPGTVRFLLSNLITLFWTLANIPTGATSPITRDNETQFAFVASGMVWSGDSYGVNKNASMTAGVCYINGRRISISAVTARTFTASLDTYIDILDNGDGTGTLVYTTASNNAASPVLAANSIRIGIIQVGVSSIAAAGSVNQGQENMILPIASSIPYAVTDSLGNLICPRDPNRRVLGYRQILTTYAHSSVISQVTGLSVPIIIPTGRKIKITMMGQYILTDAASDLKLSAWDGVVNSGTQLALSQTYGATTGVGYVAQLSLGSSTLSAGSHTINIGMAGSAGNQTLGATATSPAYLLIELA